MRYARFVAGGVEPVGSPPEKFGEHLNAEIAKWGKVVKATGAGRLITAKR